MISRLVGLVALLTSAASAQPMPDDMHAMQGHSMHGGGALPPVMHHVDAPDGAATLVVPGLGVEIVAVHLSAAGSLVDLRFRVLDLAAANPLLQSSTPTVLIDPRSGAQGQVPVDEKVGALRQNANHLRPGQVLAVLFGNPDRALKRGDKIILRLGNWEIAGLAIQG